MARSKTQPTPVENPLPLIESPVSVKEFKAFLKGMDMLKGNASWTPDGPQWARIRHQIEHLEEGSPAASKPPAFVTGMQVVSPMQAVARAFEGAPAIPVGQQQVGRSSLGDTPVRSKPMAGPGSLSHAFQGTAPQGVLPPPVGDEFV